ncbi:hypothetical protein FACS189460_5640 [Deltaproteobacteria bacterium]|nr:hypothetical protein FACS189460_5640 [Deltaproteobacteria bacterium]
MITIIENGNFVEGVFPGRNMADAYLSNHPRKKRCTIKEMAFDSFPVYIIEKKWGDFFYYSTKKEIIDYIKKIDIKELDKSEIITFYVNEDAETEAMEEREEYSLTLYTVSEPHISTTKNKDLMGLFDHLHIDEIDIKKIKKARSVERIWNDILGFRW